MMRSNPASSMQKVYDDCYLICSTAIYFEKQNNEEEALRSWRDALDQIYYHNAYKIPANYKPRTETEKALRESLREMELQCKERVDLLDALRQSRNESQSSSESPVHNGRPISQIGSRRPQSLNSDAIAQGTVPTANFSDISRPRLPSRSEQSQSTRPLHGRTSERNSLVNSLPPLVRIPSSPQQSVLSVPKVSERKSRSPSPKKEHGLLKSTLRPKTKDTGRVSSSKIGPTLRNRGSGASSTSSASASAAAASLAWPGAAQLATQAPSNGSSTSLAYPTGEPSKTLLDGFDARNSLSQKNLRVGSDQHSQPNLMDDPVPTHHTMYDLPARPKSQESRQSLLNGHDTILNNSFGSFASAETGRRTPPVPPPHRTPNISQDAVFQEEQARSRVHPPDFPSYRKEYLPAAPIEAKRIQPTLAAGGSMSEPPPLNAGHTAQAIQNVKPKRPRPPVPRKAVPMSSTAKPNDKQSNKQMSGTNSEHKGVTEKEQEHAEQVMTEASGDNVESNHSLSTAWDARVAQLMKNLPRGVDEQAAKAIFNEIVIKGDEVHWDDVAGLDIAKNALKEAVVYPFLRPDLFLGLREPARGMLLFGPPGTGKTMLARAVATESKSTFFAISASSLTSKFLGESEKLVRALFVLAKALAPSIIFVDEIDSLLSSRSGSGEHEATRRIKTEFLIQWSDLAKAAAGREQTDKDKAIGDATRVLVLAATNLPWAIDEAARRRFVRRQYIPLPEPHVREDQLRRLMSAQKHALQDRDVTKLVRLTDGFSGSDITALAKDAAMGPLRSLGEQLLHMSPDEIRPISMQDFEASLVTIRPSVSKQGLQEFEDWAKEFGERGG